jgi:hypothetical protein
MTCRLLFCFLTAAPLWGQLAFSVVTGSGETPIAAQVSLAPAAVGDTLDTLFRLRNTARRTPR